MQHYETIIVGGGPAGSSCAWALKKHNRDVVILEKTTFPRLKLCAGWITSKVMSDLEFSIEDYPHSLLEMKVRMHVASLPFSIPWFPTRWANYSIRRVEFDDWLLQRANVPVEQHHVKKIERDGDRYVIDQKYSCDHLVGAGGTMCPVRRQLFSNNRSKDDQIATLEKEFEYPVRKDDCHLFFFSQGLKGYSWYVPKGNGFVNIGIGGLSSYFKASGTNIHDHFKSFLYDLVKKGLLDKKTVDTLKETGHPYFLYAHQGEVKRDRCFVIGDSAGLASIDLGEGIGPAVESGLMVAGEIMGTDQYVKSRTSQFSLKGILRWVVEHWVVNSPSTPLLEKTEVRPGSSA